ncbi:hypothetical protein FOB58_000172 [Candida parapsilosis]|uniref:Uncharacterized protein n=2 Tax=Candida parapsilosis TaxID=5480 RepID=G8BEA4_CANPC|nr:uncharacterized protein CPAR2_212450 [Candida parapsilosis]KAF6054250.1 hypothetical protein FOB58_000172 [Candida parapsilosis]KAF6056726.1 hypothetical protein FOB59_001238 [Candida parapsilosis]KAF6059661.1 hypothetical protein FOB60_001243 [Candida parapsilosis]KAF6068414.1 hypothetical protein FOB61_001239 [Candida parapsilosis]CAD1809141.1 unnamed protein product [Candida parapsilosis]
MPKAIKQQPSKLDLVDDTTLTSLPFPPPPPIKRPSSERDRRSNALLDSNPSRHTDQTETEYVGDLDFQNIGEEVEDEDESLYEYSYEEEDPIVLVEDYYTAAPASSLSHRTLTSRSNSDHHLLRQQSLANFKKRVLSSSSNNSTDTIIIQPEQNVTTNPNTISPSSSSIIAHKQPRHHSDDLQAIFGDLPSFHLLKHCDLCDKPLYEISSIINSKSNLNLKEFVCGDCISSYEIFMTEFIQEQQSKRMKEESDVTKEPASKKIKNTKFWHVLNHISTKYNVRREVCMRERSTVN